MRTEVTIPTPEGPMRAFAFTPEQGAGPWPAALLFMDGVGIRPSLFDMGQRLADAGYYVLLPDLYWRAGPYEPLDMRGARPGDGRARERFQALRSTTGPTRQVADVGACLAWLDGQPQAAAAKVGVTGYCMGGGVALRAAAAFPDRIAAAASFHGGNLAVDDEHSPHRLAPMIRAKVLIAGADQDELFDEAQKARLAEAFANAAVDAEVTTWEGCLHGWVPADMPVHNPAGAERHWRELTALFDAALK